MKWRKRYTGLKFDLVQFDGPQTKFILSSKLSNLEQFENQEANFQQAATKSENETLKKYNAVSYL